MSEDSTEPGTSTDSDGIVIQRQAKFGQTGELEVSDEPVETSLVDFGAEVDHRERTARLDRPEAETFGRDDRPAVRRQRQAEQFPLFADVEADQQTLSGEAAAFRSLFD
jgi:hypothetical protein